MKALLPCSVDGGARLTPGQDTLSIEKTNTSCAPSSILPKKKERNFLAC